MSLTKPPVLPIWADAGDKVQPSNTELPIGWPLSNTPPARQRWNWVLNFLMNGVRYFTRRGMPDWGADETYEVGDRVQGSDGLTYKALTQNANKTPASNPSDWTRWGFTADELDTVINGKKATFIVRVASTAAINLASPGAAIDGVTMVAGNLFLEKDNGTGANRGIYVWNGAAVAATRATDADAGAELKAGALIIVTEGTANADSLWELTTNGTITIGVTTLVFSAIANTGFLTQATADSRYAGIAGLITQAFSALGLTVGANGITSTGLIRAGSSAPTSNAILSGVKAGNGIEFGFGGAQYESVLGAFVGSGQPFISLNCIAGTANNTFKTNGLPGVVISSDNNGGLIFYNVPTANADNQAPVQIGALSSAGILTVTGGASLGASGYCKLPNGLIMQWGNAATDGSGNAAWTFPIAFPTAVYSYSGQQNDANYTITPTVSALTVITWAVKNASTGAAVGAGFQITGFAIGK